MAPITLSQVDNDLKEAIQHLFEIQSAVHGYLGPETQQELVRKIKSLTQTLSTLQKNTTNLPDPNDPNQITNPEISIGNPKDPNLASIQLPPEIIDYVDAARNPDIYTREFVELVQRGNQDLKGKREAFANFRDVLAREVRSAVPGCRGEVDRVMESLGVGDQKRDGGEGGDNGGR
ncbi:mediator complex, subunit Med10 [Aspergillus caelatus]|uniref:Mediator of RNA polymerase II transcription subunit 10 n=1 Tax=Aspergillus caelatus TaxID=61420 RepID=A0A5N7AGT3_9EURO|nr:mediator complex, subunit Med10 [Aspergillus caelatus]KAE8368498.1 mediator complex, subunit Med10 [Aspergillus caelatus]